MKIEDAAICDLIKFWDLDKTYEVRARDERFLVCTSPYTVEMQQKAYSEWLSEDVAGEEPYISRKDTVYYTLVDLDKQIRSTDNFVFGSPGGYEEREACVMVLATLQSGVMELSRRNKVPLQVESVSVGDYCRYTLSHRGEPTCEIGCTDGSEYTTLEKAAEFDGCPYCQKKIRVFGEEK